MSWTRIPIVTDNRAAPEYSQKQRLPGLFVVGAILFVAEYAVMCVLPLLGLPEGPWENAVDALLLAALALPALHVMGFRPPALGATTDAQRNVVIERRTKRLLFILIASLAACAGVLFSAAHHAESPAQVINAAGKQRMLAQRLATTALLGLLATVDDGIEGMPNAASRSASIAEWSAQFDRTLHGLVHGDPQLGLPRCTSEKAVRRLGQVDEAWQSFRRLLARGPAPADRNETLARARALTEASNTVVERMDNAVESLEARYAKHARFRASVEGLSLAAILLLCVMLVAEFNQMAQHRRHLDANLAANEAYTRAILEGAADGIITINSRGMVETFNRAAEHIFGYRRSEIIGKNIRLLMPSPHREAHDGYVERYLTGGEPHVIDRHREVFALRKDGATFPIGLHVSDVRIGERRVFVGIVRDITERKRAEQERSERAAALEAANLALERSKAVAEAATAAKSEFLANMSHEVRTPMTAILGFTENLLDPSISERERRDAIQTIRRNGNYLLSLINDILDLSRLEAGKMTIERIPCSPCEVVAEVASLMRVRSDARGLAFHVAYAGPIPATIRTDATRLRQILINLVGNAIKFTEAGEVRLITRFVNDEAKPRLEFDIVDTGVGMSDEQVERLFQPFSQADATTTRRFGGTGLGLAISKRLAEMLGGEIAVIETRPDAGTRIRVSVATGAVDTVAMIDAPLTATVTAPERPKAAPAARDNTLSGTRILLAEDGLDNQRLISHFLRKAGAEVEVADNGRRAVDAWHAAHDRGRAFDVILMDMQMPVLDGYDATALLRAEGCAGPIVALTAHAMEGDRDKCLRAGCDDYTTKPIDRRKLIATVRRWAHAAGGASEGQPHATEDSNPPVLHAER